MRLSRELIYIWVLDVPTISILTIFCLSLSPSLSLSLKSFAVTAALTK